MREAPKERPVKDERDQQIDQGSKSCALEWMIAATQILTIVCLVKGNPAWKGSFSLLFFGGAFALFYKHQEYQEKAYRQVGGVLLLIGVVLLVWFGVTG